MAADLRLDLNVALTANDIDAIRAVLDRGADANSPATADQASPLLYYINERLTLNEVPNVEIVRLLLDRGANPNGNMDDGNPLVESLTFPDVVRLLLERGANPNGDGDGTPPLHWAAADGTIETIRILLDAGANVNVPDPRESGMIPLERAVVNNHQDVVELLLSRGANPNGSPRLTPPLHFAIGHLRDADMARILLEAGANPNVPDPEQDEALPLELAVRDKDAEITQLLLQRGADPNMAGTMFRDPPFITAVLSQSPDLIRLFIERGVNPNMTNRKGLPAIHLAIIPPSIAALRAGGADLNAKNPKGETPLTSLLKEKFQGYTKNAIAGFLEQGADPNTPNAKGETPMSLAVFLNDPAIILALLERGADPRATQGTGGHHAVFDIIADWETEVNSGRSYKVASVYAKIVLEMLGRGVDPNSRGDDNDTLLHRVAPYGAKLEVLPFIQNLIRAGVDPNAQADGGMTVLERIAYIGMPPVNVNRLIPIGFDPNFRNPDGTTLLHRIANRPFGAGHIDGRALARTIGRVVRFTGVDINIRNGSGETALHIAARRNNLQIVEILLEARADKTLRVEGDGGAGALAIDLTTDVAIKDLLKGYPGKSRGDIDLLLRIFDRPADVSVCPVCLAVSEREDGCRYMAHICKEDERDERIFQQFRGTGGIYVDKIEWCTECGRICDNQHRHFTLDSLLAGAPELAPVDPSRNPRAHGQIVHYTPDCRPSGGGGLEEKFVRFLDMLLELSTLQLEVGNISAKVAKQRLIGAYWNGPYELGREIPPELVAIRANLRQLAELLRNPPPAGATPEQVDEWNGRVESLKSFGVDLSVFEEDRPPAVPEPPIPDFPRPEADRALLPTRITGGPSAAGGAGGYCGPNLGPHEDGRPTFQFRHRQPDGTIYTHPSAEYICGEDLVTLLNVGRFTGKCPINSDACNADLHPDELDALGDQVPEEYRRNYRSKYNRLKAGVLLTGGRRKTYRKKGRRATPRRQRGGKIDIKSLFRQMSEDEYTCSIGAF